MSPCLAGVYAQNQEFYSGGVQIRRPENSLDEVLFFYSPELILQLTEGVQWFITEETILF